MFLGLIFLWFYDGKVTKEAVAHAIFSSFLAFLIAEVLKSVFHTARPFEINGLKAMTIYAPMDGSFPSSHSAASFALATTLWFHDRKVGLVYLLLALIVGTARVSSNVHYPVDILAGSLLGTFTAMTVDQRHFFKLFFKRVRKR